MASPATASSVATSALSRSIYDAMLSQKGLKLKLDIVDTLFLDEYGDPIAWYYTDAMTRMVKKKAGLIWGGAVELVRASAEAQGAGPAAGQPTCTCTNSHARPSSCRPCALRMKVTVESIRWRISSSTASAMGGSGANATAPCAIVTSRYRLP